MTNKILITRLAAIALATLAFAGCISEPPVAPPDGPGPNPDPTGDNVVLNFRIDGGQDYKSTVQTTYLVVYNDSGVFQAEHTVTDADRKTLQLASGNYRVAFWGNISGSNAAPEGVSTNPAPKILYIGTPNPNLGSIYYGASGTATRAAMNYYSLRVPDETSVGTHTITFVPATIDLNIYVDGSAIDQNEQYSVRVEGVPSGLNFFGMAPLADRVAVEKNATTATLNGDTYKNASFRTFAFTSATGINMIVFDSEGDEVGRQTLPSVPTPGEKIFINIGDDGIKAEVSVTIPSWNEVEITPGF